MAALAVSTLGLVACNTNNDTTTNSKINSTGTYNGTGSDSSGGFSWNVTNSAATINCPAGTYIPTAIINAPPIAAGSDYTYTGSATITSQDLVLDTSGGDGSVTSAAAIAVELPIANGETATLNNGSLLIDMFCVPASAVDSFTAG